MTDQTESIYTVGEITRAVKETIRGAFNQVTVEGEIADFTHYGGSGHMYFSLSEEGARLQAVMFRRSNQSLDFEPEEGTTVRATGRLDVYEQRGEYQLIVESMEEAGLGELEKEFQELKEKLESEGALDPARKRELPFLPRNVGVVTSGDGAAFWDIVRTLRRRCPVLRVVLYPCRVNGRESGEDIAHAVRRITEIEDLDCLIVGRGGGSPEDLWGFNTEPVARAILDCPVPVVSAVGHEVDVTIADLVADHRSATPSTAGEEVAPSLEELRARLDELTRRTRSGFRDDLDRRRDRLRFLSEKQVFADPRGWIRPFTDRFERLRDRVTDAYDRYVSDKKNELERLRDTFEALGPESVLERGYTMVSRGDEVVSSVKQVTPDDELTVRWSDGAAEVVVDQTEAAET
jgi:exodeoxyribonuclease VII large subunit